MKIYRVVTSTKADKSLLKIPHNIRKRIFRKVNSLSENPFQGSKLEGQWAGHYSVRVWPYRIIYSVHKKNLIIHVISIGHRREIYR